MIAKATISQQRNNRTIVMKSHQLLLLILSILLSGAAAVTTASSIWAKDIDAQPIAFHFSKTESSLYVFGHSPVRIVSMDPQNGKILSQAYLPTTGSATRGVAVRESSSRMDFAVIGINEGGGSSHLLCWDFVLQTPRWTFSLADHNLTWPSLGRPEIALDGTMVYHHFSGGEVYALNAFSGVAMWNKKFFPMSGWTYSAGSLYGGILDQGGDGPSIFPGIYQLDALTGDYVDRWRANRMCTGSGSNKLADYDDEDVVAGRSTCNNIWSNGIPDRTGAYLYFMDDYYGLMKFDARKISSGPIWYNAFASDNEQDNQQTYVRPVLSPNGNTVFASAYWTTAAIDADTGATKWTLPQGHGSWLTHDMEVSPYGESLYAPFGFSVHRILTTTGEIAFSTDANLLNTFLALDDQADVLFTGGFNVGAFATERLSGPSTLDGAVPGGLQEVRSESGGSSIHLSFAAASGALAALILLL